MAISAKFEADFDQFKSAVASADASLKQIGTTTQGVTGTITTSAASWTSTLTKAAGMMGVAFSVNAVKNFAIGVIDAGAAIGDMAVKLSVSAEAVQRWKYAAEQSGTTIDVVEKSIAIMNRTLAEGNKSTVAALDAAGLSFQEIRNMAPEEAFNAITEAVGKIEDPMVRAKVATVLFGRAGQDMLPAMIAGFKKVGDEVTVMSDDTIARLKAAQDAWAKLATQVTIHTGTMIAETFRMTGSWKDFMLGVTIPSWLREDVRKALGGIYDTSESTTKSLAKLGPVALSTNAGLQPMVRTVEDAAVVIAKMNSELKVVPPTVSLVEPKLGSLDTFIKNATKATETWNTGLRFTSTTIDDIGTSVDAVVPKIAAMATATTQAAAVTPQSSGATFGVSQGGGSIDTSGIQVPNLTAAFAAYTAKYSTLSAAGMIGGGPTPDFLSWALKNGMATNGAGTTVNNNINVNGTAADVARQVADEITRTVKRGSLLGAA